MIWLYGRHACLAAIKNKKRKVYTIICLKKEHRDSLPLLDKKVIVKVVDKKEFDHLFGPNIIHQGIAAQVEPLTTLTLDYLKTIDKTNQIVVVLDQVMDPHNIGAILRSCAAFGVEALIMPDRHAPKETASIAKVASGALEDVPRIQVGNLNRALETLKELGFWTVGFSEEATQALHQIDLKGKIALIMGSEGDGMRHQVGKNCDFHVNLPTTDFSTLNVSTATAIALYQTYLVQNS